MRLRPLSPPPSDPHTHKRLENKGRQKTSQLTINGRIELRRRWWHGAQVGSDCPADRWLSADDTRVTPGVREMGCRLNNSASSYDRAAENLLRTAQISLSGEQLRQLVMAEGQRVQRAQRSGILPTAFQPRTARPIRSDRTAARGCMPGVMA